VGFLIEYKKQENELEGHIKQIVFCLY